MYLFLKLINLLFLSKNQYIAFYIFIHVFYFISVHPKIIYMSGFYD
jgi:hypothetical protein